MGEAGYSRHEYADVQVSATSYFNVSNRKILTQPHPSSLLHFSKAVGGGIKGVEMKLLGKGGGSKALFTPANFGWLSSAPIDLIVNLFLHGPNFWTQCLGLITRLGTPAGPS